VKTGLVYSLGAAQVQIREGGGTLIEKEGHRECRFGRWHFDCGHQGFRRGVDEGTRFDEWPLMPRDHVGDVKPLASLPKKCFPASLHECGPLFCLVDEGTRSDEWLLIAQDAIGDVEPLISS
jgi:hypothetical protein